MKPRGVDALPRYDEDFADLVDRLRAFGLEDFDIAKFAQKVAATTAWDVVHVIDGGRDPDAGDSMPGWSLEETHSGGNLADRGIGGLHESFVDFDSTRMREPKR